LKPTSEEEVRLEKPTNFPQLKGEGVISLETYRRNGEAVATPVWFLEEDGIIYVHTDDRTGKAKRIKRNPSVRFAPSYFRGKPKGDYVQARAEIETNPEIVEKYRTKIYKKYGLMGRLTTVMQRFSRSKAKDILLLIRP
jgi:uncharacterized protein